MRPGAPADRVPITVCFSHPAVDGFIYWGFVKRNGARDGIYDDEWRLTQAGAVYRELVFEHWWTEADLRTDATGTAAVDVFHGDYEVTVVAPDGRRRAVPARIEPDGGRVTVHLPASDAL